MESKPGPRFALLAGTATRAERPPGTRVTGSPLETERPRGRVGVDGDPGGHDVTAVGRAQGPLRVLEAVAGHGADDARTRRDKTLRVAREQARDRGRRARLDEDPLLGGEEAVSLEDLL